MTPSLFNHHFGNLRMDLKNVCKCTRKKIGERVKDQINKLSKSQNHSYCRQCYLHAMSDKELSFSEQKKQRLQEIEIDAIINSIERLEKQKLQLEAEIAAKVKNSTK